MNAFSTNLQEDSTNQIFEEVDYDFVIASEGRGYDDREILNNREVEISFPESFMIKIEYF